MWRRCLVMTFMVVGHPLAYQMAHAIIEFIHVYSGHLPCLYHQVLTCIIDMVQE